MWMFPKLRIGHVAGSGNMFKRIKSCMGVFGRNDLKYSVYHKLEMRGKIFANQSVFVMSAEKGL